MIPLRTGIHIPVAMQFAVSVVTAARRHDHDVLLLTQEEGEAGLHRVADTALVDALIVMDVQLRRPPAAVAALTGPADGPDRLPFATGGSDLYRPGLQGGGRVVRGTPRRASGTG